MNNYNEDQIQVEVKTRNGQTAHVNANNAEDYVKLRDAVRTHDTAASCAASEDDRLWFDKHPRRVARLRRRQRGELADTAAGEHIITLRLTRGQRVRIAVEVRAGTPRAQVRSLARDEDALLSFAVCKGDVEDLIHSVADDTFKDAIKRGALRILRGAA